MAARTRTVKIIGHNWVGTFGAGYTAKDYKGRVLKVRDPVYREAFFKYGKGDKVQVKPTNPISDVHQEFWEII
jgi:hypothetical protein